MHIHQGMQGIGSLTRGQTYAPCSGSRVLTSGPLGNSLLVLLKHGFVLILWHKSYRCFLKSVSQGNCNKNQNKQMRLIKLASFCTARETTSRMKRQPMKWKKICANDGTNKGFISKYTQASHTTQQRQQQKIQHNWKKGTRRHWQLVNRDVNILAYFYSRRGILEADYYNRSRRY